MPSWPSIQGKYKYGHFRWHFLRRDRIKNANVNAALENATFLSVFIAQNLHRVQTLLGKKKFSGFEVINECRNGLVTFPPAFFSNRCHCN
jgi:hypothetical protein